MRALVFGALCAALSLAASCAPQGQAGACADGGQPLAVSGLCPAEAATVAQLDPAPVLDGPYAACAWTLNEVAIGDGSEAVLYRALSCEGATASLAYAGGAHGASLSYASTAIGSDDWVGRDLVWLFVSDPIDAQKPIRDLIVRLPAAEQAKCEVQPAAIEAWPEDALVIGYNAMAAQALPQDEPNAVCGEFGLNEDAIAYWRIRQGYAWFFNLGQETDFDPESFTILRRDDHGAWTRAG